MKLKEALEVEADKYMARGDPLNTLHSLSEEQCMKLSYGVFGWFEENRKPMSPQDFYKILDEVKFKKKQIKVPNPEIK